MHTKTHFEKSGVTMLKNIFCKSILLVAACQLQACSVLYDIQQDAALDKCKQMIDSYQRNECLKRNNTSFDQYEKQRQEALRK